jgi:two-component system nitrate/nitrite sensor histidine kinase NarX
MRTPVGKNRTGWAAAAVLALALLAGDIWLGAAFGWPLAAALLAGAAGWGAAWFFRGLAERRARSAREAIDQAQTEALRTRTDAERRLQAALTLNHLLAGAAADALDERALMESALEAVTRLSGALGCSFVPVDEWQQPLPPFTYGQLPAPVLSAWSAHLASGMLRERCAACQVLHSTPGGCPLHPLPVGDALTVFCMPLPDARLNGENGQKSAVGAPARPLGVLHLYLPAGRALEPEARAFLETILPDISLAYEAARLRSQELATMRHLRLLHAGESDFAASLGGLLESTLRALEVDFVLIRLRAGEAASLPGEGGPPSAWNLQRGSWDALEPAAASALLEAAQPEAFAGRLAQSAPGRAPAWLAVPLLAPAIDYATEDTGRSLGVLVAGADRPYSFHPRQQAILQTIAAQAALLLENERLVRSLEYKVVIQERARLAREIHDGLAQTLAYLKLQAAQMQAYLEKGDVARLGQVLKDNYQALAEAYLDTRQAIDHLRLTPQEGLEEWIGRVLRELEETSGLAVEYNLEPLERPVSPEIQAQLIRIVQEALNNVRKHARAHQVQLNLRVWEGELVLEVTDDGLGFDACDVPEVSRHGLRGMRERAEMIGADFQIISRERQGTTVRLALPIPYPKESTP